MNTTKLFAIAIMLLLSARSYAVDSSLSLNGAAMYSEIGHSYYVGGLYLETPSDDLNIILLPSTRKLMQIVVTKNDWSKRGWTRHWRNRIAINNPDATDDAEAFKALAEFTTMVKGELRRGDEVVVEYRTGMTEVRLNGEKVLQSRGGAVMKYLLLTWVGSIPPSSSFRKDILALGTDAQASANKKLLSTYKLPVGREALYSSWVEKDNEIKAEQERKLAEIKAAAEAQRKRAAAQLAAREKAEKERAERDRARKEKQAAEKLAKQQKVKEEKPKPPEKNAATIAEERQAEQDYYKSIVQWQVQRYVFNNVEYPHWARNFSEEGLAELTYEFNSQKEVDISERSSDIDAMLVKELERAVRKGVSLAAIPSGLDGNRWKLSANYLFSLKGETLPGAVPPLKPAHLEDKKLSQNEQDTLMEQYRNDLVKSVKKIIVYPERAKMSRHRGRITANITLDRWGEVKNIELVKATRFDYLNESVITAIEQNAPFGMFPLEVSAESTVVELEHRFH